MTIEKANLRELFSELHKASSFNDALKTTIGYLCKNFDYVLGEAWVPDREQSRLDYLLTHHIEQKELEDFVAKSNNTHFKKGVGLPGRVWESGLFEWADDIQKLGPELFKRTELAAEANLHQALSIPIKLDQKTVAVLVLFKHRAHAKNSFEFSFIESVALELGYLLQRIKLAEELSLAKLQTDSILHHTNDGLFLLDRDLRIGSEHSMALKAYLMSETLVGKELIDLLRPLTSSQIIADVERFLSLMFKAEIDLESLLSLNPLKRIQFSYSGPLATKKVRTLSFNFSRIYSKTDISALFVSIHDHTAETELLDRLEKQEDRAREELELLGQILHIQPNLLKDFLGDVQSEIEEGLYTLHEDEALSLQQKLDSLFVKMHNIKGNANMIQLQIISRGAHLVEEEIWHLKNLDQLSSSNFVSLIVLIETLEDKIEKIKNLIDRLVSFSSEFGSRQDVTLTLKMALKNLVENLSKQYRQQSVLTFSHFELANLPLTLVRETKDVLIQLIKNTFAHGLEEPVERLSRNKTEELNIKISIVQKNKQLHISYADDGRGIDMDALERSARQRGITLSKNAPKISLLFFNGLSTKEEISELAGRGVGMSLVKKVLQKYQGLMRVKTKPFEGLHFLFSFEIHKETK